jgi:diacylglycerol kinase family enzyme
MGISTLVVVNTTARNVRSGLRWARIEAQVMRRLAPAELEIVAGPKDAEQTAWDSAIAGYGRLVVVGDLPTATGFVNGLMRLSEGHRRALRVGFLSLGRPDAWCRALAVAADVERQVEVLSAGNVLPYDVGRVDCVDAAGQPVTRYFLAGAALWTPSFPRPHGAVAAATVTCGGEVVHQGQWGLAFAMQSPYYPGLGLVSPEANPSDGALDVAWVDAAGVSGLAKRMLISLLHIPAGFTHKTAHELRLANGAGSPELHVDGSPVGRLPATISVVPRALQVIVESVASRLREKQKALLEDMPGAALAGHYKRVSRG